MRSKSTAFLLLCLFWVFDGALSGKGGPPPPLPCADLPPPASPVPAQNTTCSKFIFLHIPKCAGTSVMNAFAPLRKDGVHVVGYRDYEKGRLHGELAAEAADPLRWPKKVIEIHVARTSGPYVKLHPQIMSLRKTYEQAGCNVALGTLVRDPESLAMSWYTYCSTKLVAKDAKRRVWRAIPPYWAFMKACGRKDVLTNFLYTGEFCGQGKLNGTKVVPRRLSDVQRLADMLMDFDLIDDVTNLPVWMARVFRFLGKEYACAVPVSNLHSKTYKDISPARQRIAFRFLKQDPSCGRDDEVRDFAHKRIDRGPRDPSMVAAIPESVIYQLFMRDKQLYRRLLPRIRAAALEKHNFSQEL